MPNIISLFAGCGAWDIGFRRAGFGVVWANDHSKRALATYRANHPTTPVSDDDLLDIDTAAIPQSDGVVGHCYWTPERERATITPFAEIRGGLLAKYVDIVSRKRPKFFVFCHPRECNTTADALVVNEFWQHLCDAGYYVSAQWLNASDYRIPQDRRNLYFVGFRRDLHTVFRFPQGDGNRPPTVSDAIADLTATAAVCEPLPQYGSQHGCAAHRHNANSACRWDSLAPYIPPQASLIPLHPNGTARYGATDCPQPTIPGTADMIRRLNVRECARLQTFPDSYKFVYDDTSTAYRMIGNSVPPRLAYRIAEAIAAQLKESPRRAAGEGVVMINMWANDYRPYILDFCAGKEEATYYFGRHVIFRPGEYSVFVPLINGKFSSLYQIVETTRRPRTELPAPKRGMADPYDLRMIVKLRRAGRAFSCPSVSLSPAVFDGRHINRFTFPSFEEFLQFVRQWAVFES